MDKNAEAQYLNEVLQDLNREKVARRENEISTSLGVFQQKKDPSILAYQLDMATELDKAYHYLKGDMLINDKWVVPTDDSQIILTETGVQQIMVNFLDPYLQKDIILGNYDDEQINAKMEVILRDLTYFILHRSNEFFHYPKAWEIYDKLEAIRYKTGMYKQLNDYELYQEAHAISRSEFQKKLAHMPVIVGFVLNKVHGSYMRARGGTTFKELTRHTTVSEMTTSSGAINGGIKTR